MLYMDTSYCLTLEKKTDALTLYFPSLDLLHAIPPQKKVAEEESLCWKYRSVIQIRHPDQSRWSAVALSSRTVAGISTATSGHPRMGVTTICVGVA